MSHVLLGPESLEYCFGLESHGLSARRLWEHTEMGQINVFGKDISSRQDMNDAEMFIDIVKFDGDTFGLTGLTLADLRVLCNSRIQVKAWLDQLEQSSGGLAFISSVQSHLGRCAIRQAVRDQQHRFLPTAGTDDVFGVPLVYSALQRRLQSMGKSRARAEQWLKTIDNIQKKGLRAEEIERSKLGVALKNRLGRSEQPSALELVDLCGFRELRLSVIPVLTEAQRQLRFVDPPSKKLNRVRNLPKALIGLPRALTVFDPVLGYRIEHVDHQTLWGSERHWQAVTYSGKMLRTSTKQAVFQNIEGAEELAASHAKQNFPKRMALGRFNSWAWTGGNSYREWLISLPYYPASYLSGHFRVRNVLAHVRCDAREGADGERVLMVQEVQSDWAQQARRAIACGTMNPDDDACPPFLKEWPALAMKLVVVHAAHQGFDAVAWTRGAHQVFRYNGRGADGLNELYDRRLPRDVERMMTPFGANCETVGVYVPTNFSIKQTERGYEVYSLEKVLMGIAPTFEDARQFVPDEGHELLYKVHGVRLPAAVRKAVLEKGFPAWG